MLHKSLIRHFGKAIVRTPLYSYRRLFNHSSDTRNLNDVIAELLADDIFMEGLYWSSPQLYDTVTEYKKDSSQVGRDEKLLHTLKKYAIRACTRPTPYGVFAGCDLVTVNRAENTKREMRRKVRIDLELLREILLKIEIHPVLWKHLRYQLNNTIYVIADEFRFIEKIVTDEKAEYQVSSIERTELLEKLQATLSRQQALTIPALFEILNEDVSFEDFEAFVHELFHAQFLVSELQPGVTFDNDLDIICCVLKRMVKEAVSEADEFLILLTEIQQLLGTINGTATGCLPIEAIRNLEAMLADLHIEPRQRHLFHTDLLLPDPAFCCEEGAMVKGLARALDLYSRLSQQVSPPELPLERFKKKFIERYEGREMPLMEVMDPELGLGFPVIESIGNVAYNSFAERMMVSAKKVSNKKASEGHAWLMDRIEAFGIDDLVKGIDVQTDDLEDYDSRMNKLPPFFSVMGTMLPSGKIWLQHVGGAHSNILLGRFAYLSEEMELFSRQLAEEEARLNEDVLYAELIYAPDGRVGNIVRRPSLATCEIPLLAPGSVVKENQVSLDDIMLSVQGEELQLRSKRLNKRIIPRLSNAHNYFNSSIAVYKLLASLQYQGLSGLEINWGSLVQHKRFLPRIGYGNFIFHRASWFLRASDIQEVLQSADQVAALRMFFGKWKVPRLVSFCEGDNELFIDTGNDSYLQLLLKEMRGLNTVKLTEWLYGEACVKEEQCGSGWAQQFILPVALNNERTARSVHVSEAVQLPRTFEPGSEWVFCKIYCGAGVSDHILLKAIKPAIDYLLSQGYISKAFFIRYTDPHYHIRLRLLLRENDDLLYAGIIRYIYNALHPYLESRLIWKVQQDTYEREMERYGEEYILLTETLFFHDSFLFLHCLEEEGFEEDEQLRLLAALKNLHEWLELYNMPLTERIAFCSEMADAFATEFGREMRKQLNSQYMEWRKDIAVFMRGDRFAAAFTERTRALNNIEFPIDNISSYIHMSMNRWFTVEQRFMEYMVYYFAARYYNQIVHQSYGSQS